MKTLFGWFYRLYAWLILIPFAFLWSFLFGWLAMLSAVLISQRFASMKVGGLWARVIGWVTPMRVTVTGAEHIDPKRSYVVVANHQSQYDILVVYGWLDMDLRWVMKQELRKLPGLGIGCEKVGHIFVDRKNPEKARKAIYDALDRINDGVGMMFFPEGTRSDDGRLLQFKRGAFRVAEEQKLPVLPLTILGTREILPTKTFNIRPGRAQIVVHEPIEPGEMNARELAKEARARIASVLPDSED